MIGHLSGLNPMSSRIREVVVRSDGSRKLRVAAEPVASGKWAGWRFVSVGEDWVEKVIAFVSPYVAHETRRCGGLRAMSCLPLHASHRLTFFLTKSL